MPQNIGSETILSLAILLNDIQVKTEIITKALKLICNDFSFECGLVYETDFTNQFILMEHYGLDRDSIEDRKFIEFLALEDQQKISRMSYINITRNNKNTPLEIQLLNLHKADTLFIMPVVDEHFDTNGFLILLNMTHKTSYSEVELRLISNVLSMLMRYVGIRMYEKKLVQIQATLESVLDNAGVDIYVNDFYNHDILYTNESMAAPYGGKDKFLGKKCWQVLFPGQNKPCEFCPQKKLIDENGMPTKVYSWDYQRAFDGAWFRVFSAAFHWVDGRLAHVVSSADITENKLNEALIENLANYDQLTQLPNRRSLIHDCEHRIMKATQSEKGYLLFFDIDGFKNINDNFGHDAGDEFLIQLGAFFSAIPLLKGAIYRNGGDEFVALVGGESITKDHITYLADFIHKRFKKVWKLKNGEVLCNTSIGVACYPEDGHTPQELLQKADKAMYHVKNAGGGDICFGYQF